MTNLIRLGIYLGIGAFCHLIFIGSHFDWSNAWTWLWLVGWPVMLFITFWVVIIVFIVVALIVAGILTIVGGLR